MSVWVPLSGLVDGPSLTFVILPSGLIAINESRLDPKWTGLFRTPSEPGSNSGALLRSPVLHRGGPPEGACVGAGVSRARIAMSTSARTWFSGTSS